MGGEVVKPDEIKNIKQERFGVEIWRQIAFLLLALLFVELLMTSRRTKTQAAEAVEVC